MPWILPRFRPFTLILTLAPWCPAVAQDIPLALPGDVSPSADIREQPEVIPDLNIEAKAEILEKTIQVGSPFHYQITLSWEGRPDWVSLQSPAIEFPKTIRQVEVSTGVRSAAGESGPTGSKYFKYTLECHKAGEQTIPPIQIEVMPKGKSSITVEAPETRFTVLEKTVTASEKAGAFIQKNVVLLAGGAFAILAGLVVFLISWAKPNKVEEPPPNPWASLDPQEKKLEALRNAGEGREFYGLLEALTLQALSVVYGPSAPQSLARAAELQSLRQPAREHVDFLVSEISDRKFRPDRPLPENMDSALKHFRSLVRILKQNSTEGGQTE